MAAGWSNHEGHVGLLISKQIREGALESRRWRKRETYSFWGVFLPQASVGLLLQDDSSADLSNKTVARCNSAACHW